MKKSRSTEAQAVIDAVVRQPCLACPRGQQRFPTDPDHVTTRGAGGQDREDNVWPLCREHHAERHQRGILTVVRKYPKLLKWLCDHERDDILDRL